MIGSRAHNAHSDPISFIPAGKTVDNINPIPRVKIVNGTLSIDFPDLVVGSAMRANGSAARDDSKGS
jgi:hypothetical protein